MIDPARVASILSRLHDLGTIRKSPNADDLRGEFDAWFDGGAYLVVTGSMTYFFNDQARAVVSTGPGLFVRIQFPEGVEVLVQERSLNPTPPIDWERQLAPPVSCAGCGGEIAAGSTHKFVDGKPYHMAC